MRAKVIVVLTFLLFSVASGLAGTEKVLYSFTGGTDGAQPYQAGVIFDSAGNLYGVTQYGGLYGQGTVFKLTPSPDGTWTETVIYSFTGGADGANPQGGLVSDTENIYGTTAYGGENNDSCGTLFIVYGGIEGQFEVLHTFNDLTGDACQPESDLSFDGEAIWGTTAYGGGPSEPGTVFAYQQGDYGALHCPRSRTGWYPNGLSLFGNSIYGTAYSGGEQTYGNVFELSYRQIEAKHVFTSKSKEGDGPVGNLATQVNPDGVRIMYGTTSGGGVGGGGAVYQLTERQQRDVWAISLLHSFSGSDGAGPWAGVVLDPAGNLYGTTSYGGTDPGYAGTVFKLTPGANNKWTLTVEYSFSGGTDGNAPTGSVVLDSAGNLYGTTVQGGAYNQGVVYEVAPSPATTTALTSSPNPSTYGQAVTFTAVVTSSAGAPPDGETVSFIKGKTVLGTGSLSGGSASFTISTLPKGTNSITAAYGGDSHFVGSTSNVVKQKVERPGSERSGLLGESVEPVGSL